MDSDFDIAIIGAGIAGASLGYFLESGARVLLLEAESAPGYHTTGRSAAFWVATYGGRFIEPLTSASKPFFDAPPPGFGDAPLLGPRGGLHLAPPQGADDRDHEAATALDDLEAEFAGSGLRFERYDTATLRARYPLLRDAWATDAMLEPDSYDIDVARLHAGFLAGMRRRGASQVCDARVTELQAGRDALVLNLGGGLASLQARILSLLPNPPLSPDNLRSMQVDNLTDGARNYPDWNPKPLESIAPSYLSKVKVKRRLDGFRRHAGRAGS